MFTKKGTTEENGDISYILQQTDVQVNQPGLCVDPFGLPPLEFGQLCAGIVGPTPHDSCQVSDILEILTLYPNVIRYKLVFKYE